jgi:hypothetical protein
MRKECKEIPRKKQPNGCLRWNMLALLIIPAGIAGSEVNGDGNGGAGELDTLDRGSR